MKNDEPKLTPAETAARMKQMHDYYFGDPEPPTVEQKQIDPTMSPIDEAMARLFGRDARRKVLR